MKKFREKSARRAEDKYPVGSRVIPFDMPKYAKRILTHLAECFADPGCILCSDCLAYALLQIEDIEPIVRGQPYVIAGIGPRTQFVKFLCSTLSGAPKNLAYNPCPHNRMHYDDVHKFALYLLRLTPEQRRILRGNLFCHAEFKFDEPSPPQHRKLGRKLHVYR